MVTTLGRVDPLQDLRRRFGPVDTSVRFLTTVDVHLAAPLQPNLLRLHKWDQGDRKSSKENPNLNL